MRTATAKLNFMHKRVAVQSHLNARTTIMVLKLASIRICTVRTGMQHRLVHDSHAKQGVLKQPSESCLDILLLLSDMYTRIIELAFLYSRMHERRLNPTSYNIREYIALIRK